MPWPARKTATKEERLAMGGRPRDNNLVVLGGKLQPFQGTGRFLIHYP